MINARIFGKSWLIIMYLEGYASISIEAINPFQPCPGPGRAFTPDSLLAGYQGSRLAEMHVGLIFSVAGLWCDVVSYNGSHVYVFCTSGFWKKTFTRPVQKTDLGSLSCLGYSSHVSFSIGLIYITDLLLSCYVLIISFFLPFFPLLFYHFSLSAVLSPNGRIMR